MASSMSQPKIWHTQNEHAIIKAMNAKKRGRGADGIDQDGFPFEIRESRKTPKFRLQRDVHEDLVRNDGYYLFKQGGNITKIFAKDVTPLLKKGEWSHDRAYPYKYLHCKDIKGSGISDKSKQKSGKPEKVDNLPPTNLQEQLIDDYIHEKGYAAGVIKIYKRLMHDFPGDHPAMNSAGHVVYDDDGEPWEFKNTPKNVQNHKYVHEGVQYEYETRPVVKNGVQTLERRRLAPTIRSVAEALGRSERHQKKCCASARSSWRCSSRTQRFSSTRHSPE